MSRFQIAGQQHLTLTLPNSQIHFIKNLDGQLYQIYVIRISVSYNFHIKTLSDIKLY